MNQLCLIPFIHNHYTFSLWMFFPWFGLRLAAEFDVLIELWQMALTDGTNSSDEEEKFLPKRRISRPNGQQLLRFSFFLPIQSARTGSAAGLVERNKRVLCVCFVQLATKLKNPPRGGQLKQMASIFLTFKFGRISPVTRAVNLSWRAVGLFSWIIEQRSSAPLWSRGCSLPNKV